MTKAKKPEQYKMNPQMKSEKPEKIGEKKRKTGTAEGKVMKQADN